MVGEQYRTYTRKYAYTYLNTNIFPLFHCYFYGFIACHSGVYRKYLTLLSNIVIITHAKPKFKTTWHTGPHYDACLSQRGKLHQHHGHGVDVACGPFRTKACSTSARQDCHTMGAGVTDTPSLPPPQESTEWSSDCPFQSPHLQIHPQIGQFGGAIFLRKYFLAPWEV